MKNRVDTIIQVAFTTVVISSIVFVIYLTLTAHHKTEERINSCEAVGGKIIHTKVMDYCVDKDVFLDYRYDKD